MARKKASAARYSAAGIALALIGALGAAGFGIVRGAMALGLYTPANPESVRQWLLISLGVFALGIGLYGILNPAGVRRFLSGRQARYGSNALIMSLAFGGILVVANWIAYQNPQKFDLSEGKQHTLAPETIQALDTLPEKVTAIAFFSSQYPSDTARSLLNDFKSGSSGKFDFTFVDPNADPILAQQYGITGDGRIVLVMGALKETATYADENTLTQAMIRLISPQSRVVYFLAGHGEPDLKASDATSVQRAKSTLESKNYTVESLSLAASNAIPSDAKAIVIVGAKDHLLNQEVEMLTGYLQGGGSLVVLADPTPFSDIGKVGDPLAAYLAESWGIALQDTVVIDLTSNQPFTAISASYSSTAPITSQTTSFTLMPEARSLAVSPVLPENVTVIPLILTSPQSWGETDLSTLASSKDITFDEATDLAGPLTVAASGENSQTRGRVVVFGNSAFARNEAFDAYANGEIFTNSVDWAAQETDLINITPRTPVVRSFNPPGQLAFLLILLGSVFLIPGLVLVAGISSWLARRRQG